MKYLILLILLSFVKSEPEVVATFTLIREDGKFKVLEENNGTMTNDQIEVMLGSWWADKHELCKEKETKLDD